MNDADKKQFFEVLSSVYMLYGKDLSKPVAKIYWSALSEYSYDKIANALTAHAKNPDNGQFLPKPADIIRQIDGDSESRALKAWAKVERAVRSVGSYDSVVFDEPAIMASVENLGGWIRLCEMKEDELPFRRNEFCKLYKGFLIKPPETYPRKLIGITEGHNQIDYKECIQPPVMIGRHDNCLAVLDHKSEPVQIVRQMAKDTIKRIK